MLKTIRAIRLLSLLLVTTVLITSISTPTLATEQIDGSVGSKDDYNSGAMKPGDARYWDGDAWEVTLYIGSHKGSYLLYGPQTVAGGAPPAIGGDGEQRVWDTNWGPSNGQRYSTEGMGGSGITGNKKYDADCPPWNSAPTIFAWGTSIEKWDKYVFAPLERFCGLDSSIREKFHAQWDEMNGPNPPTEEEIAQKLASGEYIDCLVSMEPVMLIYYASGGTTKFDFNKRQEHYTEWSPKGATAWQFICQTLGNAFVVDDVPAGEHNQPHDWSKGASWPQMGTQRRDNYALFWPTFMPGPPKPPPPPDITTEDGFPEFRILEEEILANPDDNMEWCEDTDGNKFASALKEIKVKEKNFTQLEGHRHHYTRTDAPNACDYQGPDDDEPCGADYLSYFYCDRKWDVVWDAGITVNFNEDDLKSEENVMGTNVDTGNNPFSTQSKPANKYQMTRKDGVMDLDWCNPGTIFDEYSFQNADPSPSDRPKAHFSLFNVVSI